MDVFKSNASTKPYQSYWKYHCVPNTAVLDVCMLNKPFSQYSSSVTLATLL